MNEIKNYTMNFSFGRSRRELNLLRKLASTEIHCVARNIASDAQWSIRCE
jgi:hypothetical protein